MNVKAIQTVAVLGLGTMGHGIAQTFAVAGYQVRGYDEQSQPRDALSARVKANLEQMAEAGVVDEAAIPPALERITTCPSEMDAVGPAEFVVEAVREDLSVKQELFGRVESVVRPDTVLASNTSSYPITAIAAGMRQPERAVATHWFNPPHIIPVVEVVPGQKTAPETVQTTFDLLERIGKLPVRLNYEIPGFLVNRIQVAMFREIWDLLDRGIASAEEIDRAVRGSVGLRLAALGPLAIIDFAGWDVTGRVYQNLVTDLRSDTELPQQIETMLQAGRFGVKTGRGIYDYPAGSIEQRLADRDRTYLALIRLLKERAEREPT